MLFISRPAGFKPNSGTVRVISVAARTCGVTSAWLRLAACNSGWLGTASPGENREELLVAISLPPFLPPSFEEASTIASWLQTQAVKDEEQTFILNTLCQSPRITICLFPRLRPVTTHGIYQGHTDLH